MNVSTGLVSYQRVAEIIREEREDTVSGSVSMQTAISGAVTFEDVSFAYEPQPVLQPTGPRRQRRREKDDAARLVGKPDESDTEGSKSPCPCSTTSRFNCGAGQSVALLGSTGSGKTSIINLLLRFYDHQSGSITLDGMALHEYPRALLRRNIGIVEQEPFLFSRSIRENITYGVHQTVSDVDVEAAARAAAIHDIIVAFPDGYETVVGEKG